MQKINSDISILIAEDEDQLRGYFVEYLQIFFDTVYEARCGKEALEVYKQKKPDIIIADINMPNLDGLSMIEQIRKTDKKTKIIVVTAHSDKDKLLQAIELNLVKYIIKPVKSDELKELLFRVIEEMRSESGKIPLKENFCWDTNTKTLTREGEAVELKEKERRLLDFLFEHANQSVSNEDIYNHLFADRPNKEFSINAITSLVKRVRAKIPDKTITNIYGVGYKIHTDF